MAARKQLVSIVTALGLALGAAGASAAPITITKLTGLLGSVNVATAVFRGDLSSVGLGQFQSITIQDNSAPSAGSPGQFTGFDLDAIIISDQFCTDAACVAALTPLNVFDYSSAGTFFTPGSQVAPTDPKLFGTTASGNAVDNGIATLGLFDGNSTTGADAAGFVSMGLGGRLSFNLTQSLLTEGLYLYFGEVGDNGEALAGSITIARNPVGVAEPLSLALFGLGLAGLGLSRTRRLPTLAANLH